MRLNILLLSVVALFYTVLPYFASLSDESTGSSFERSGHHYSTIVSRACTVVHGYIGQNCAPIMCTCGIHPKVNSFLLA
ncbi:hypothetical protein B0J17DRAFT_680900 [Rhizoctonia solani]|nr:hypothetical protein B0J17DRAFT_680900 [Rhizoctonia solani]